MRHPFERCVKFLISSNLLIKLIICRLVSAFQDKVIDSLTAKHMKGPAIVREAMRKAKERVNAGKKFNATALFKHFVHQVSKARVLIDPFN